MKKYRVTLKGNDGSLVHTSLLARSADEAKELAIKSHEVRGRRFDRTFARLEVAKAEGDAGLLAVPPGMDLDKKAVASWAKQEEERRKRDAGRYEGDFKVQNVEEVS